MISQSLGCHIIIINGQGKVLVLKRSMNDEEDPDKWDMPGGGIGAEEDLIEGIKREVREEAGLEIEKIELIGAYTIENDRLQLLAKAQSTEGVVKLSSEHNEFKWINNGEFLTLLPAGLHLRAAQYILKTGKRVVTHPNY